MSCTENHLRGIFCVLTGVPCIRENCTHFRQALTNHQALQRMSGGELARALLELSSGGAYCKHLEDCLEAVEHDKEIPDSRCIDCIRAWLQEVYREGSHA